MIFYILSDGNVQETLREIELKVLNETVCEKTVQDSSFDHKYCTAEPGIAKNTLQVVLFIQI
jgi:hypothetical protein